MMAPDLTLNKVKTTAKTKVHRASDFLTQEQMDEVKSSNAKGKKRSFDVVDAYIAEIIARFGYDTYTAWKCGDISEETMIKFINAERARDVQRNLVLENIIVASIAGANQPTKGGHSPKSLKLAIKMLKKEEERAKGEA